MEIILNFLKQNRITVIQAIIKGFISIWEIWIRPFFFSKNKKAVIVPYIYVFIGMGLFIASVILFIKLSWMAATVGIKDATIILPTISSVIGIMVAMMTFMVKVYNDGKTVDTEISVSEDKPGGVL